MTGNNLTIKKYVLSYLHFQKMWAINQIDFTQFNSIKYNTLLKVNVASNILHQHSNFVEFLEKIYSLTKIHSIELGVRLIHRHMQVDEGKVMIEKFQFHQNSPAFITSADSPTAQAFPASWLLENDDKISVFEYSTDVLVKHVLEKLIEDPSIFVNICDLIREYHFENLLAPCITARTSLKHFEKKDGFLEITDFETNASIVKSKKDQEVGDAMIPTLWAYSVNDNCFGCDHRCVIHCSSNNHCNFHCTKENH
ncbi:hypothetical protein Glove_245g10 [Diversispora epigaea]|uniref:Uncharacterized protein n=1 Tax=Diversispora epigaea TaxID=1348612 RepID=A0A397IBB6_9GLOM|nr:hypothetical protein Glove_245g10 [Diversispora epigaea]